MTKIRFIATVALLGCSPPESPSLTLSQATVELDAFSGRPNPRWQLTAGEARDLSARLSELERADGATLPDVGLGYRGFYVHNVGGERIYYITHGLVAFVRGDQTRAVYRDGRGAEAALKAQARARGFGGVFRAPAPSRSARPDRR
jgi:hypothetical protein